jgi:hypothetical protein
MPVEPTRKEYHLRTTFCGHADAIYCLAISTDGKVLASGGESIGSLTTAITDSTKVPTVSDYGK